MNRGWALALGLVVGVAAAWLTGLAFNPLADSDDAATDLGEADATLRMQDEIAALSDEVTRLRRMQAHGPARLEGSLDGPSHSDAKASPTPVPIRNRSKRAPQPGWWGGADIPAGLPKELRGTPLMWIEALKLAVKRHDVTAANYFAMALVAVGKDAGPPLRDLLLDANQPALVRTHALTALRGAAPELLGVVAAEMLRSEPDSSELRKHALHALARSSPTSVPDIVIEIAGNNDRPLAERQAAWTVQMHADSTAFTESMRYTLRNGNDSEKTAAYQVLRQAYRKELRPFLHEVTKNAPPKHQAGLMQALARMKGPGWGDAQMTGAPDTPRAGDNQTAWASLKGEEGLVWVELDFEREVSPEEVRIHETFNPGAVIRIEARTRGGDLVTLWSGTAAPAGSKRWFDPTLERLDDRVRTIRIVLDTDKVKGWNEIDAVELVGEGQRQWASAARSSSCYARR